MPVEYPILFPRPVAVTLEPAERRALSTVGPLTARARQRDFLASVSVDFPPMPAEQVEAFYTWWKTTLDSGGRWFVAWDWPTLQGFAPAVYRFLGVPKFVHIAKGVQSIKAQMQIRGRGELPQLTVQGQAAYDDSWEEVIFYLNFEDDAVGSATPKDLALGAESTSYYWLNDELQTQVSDDKAKFGDHSWRERYQATAAFSNRVARFPSRAEYAMGTGDFTVEYFGYFAGAYSDGWPDIVCGADGAFDSNFNVAWALGTYGGGYVTAWVNGTRYRGGLTVPNGQWAHLAMTRTEGVLRLFLNGLLTGGNLNGTWSGVTANLPAYQISIGGPVMAGASRLNAYVGGGTNYLDSFRVTKASRYTENFTPPLSEFSEGEPPVPSTPPSMLTPRIVALNYTQDYTDAVDDSRYGLVIRGFSTGQAATNGATYGATLLANNPSTALAQYVILNELKDPVSAGQDHYALWLEVNARDWWVYNEPTHTKAQWSSSYGAYETNFTTFAPLNPSGKRYPQYKADWDFSQRIDNLPDATWVFSDNIWKRPRVTADYDRNGSNETPAVAENYFAAGHIAYAAALRAKRAGLKIIANANNDLSGVYVNIYDAAFNEGCVGKSYGTFATGGIMAVRALQLAHINNTLQGMAILNAYGASTDYKTFRLALTMAMMFDSWLCPIDETGGFHPVWMDEFAQEIGTRTDDIPSAAVQNDIWACRFTNGVVFCNPTNTAQNIDTTPFGSLTRFLGTQAPTVNTGDPVSGTITIPAKDGLMLINA